MSSKKNGDSEPNITPGARRAITLSSTLGYMFDAYAINIYGMTLALIAVDYHTSTKVMGLIASIFLVGYMLGSVGFGVLGDALGRKKTVITSICVYGGITALTGFAINPWQFAFGRFLTGLGGGGELTVGVPYVVESWSPRRRGLGAGIMFAGYAAGVVYAAIVAKPILAWFGWRALYFAAIIPAAAILALRLILQESPLYKEVAEKLKHKNIKKVSFGKSLRENPKTRWKLFFGTMIYISLAVIYYSQTVFMVPYMVTSLHLKIGTAIMILALFNVGMFCLSIGCGWLCDQIGRKIAGSIVMVVLAASIWTMFSTTSFIVFIVFGFLSYGCIGGSWTIGMAHVAEMFPTGIRASGYGWSVGLGRIPSILAPFVIGWLAEGSTGGMGDAMKWSSLILVCGLVAYLWGPETRQIDAESEPLPVGVSASQEVI